MDVLKGQDIIRIMREEWAAGVRALAEQIDVVMSSPVAGDDPVISPELKVRHKTSQIRYTVSSVGPHDVILRTPEGEDFLVSKEDLEREYELD